MPQKAKSPARQGWPGQGFAGSVATLPMLATLLRLLHWLPSFLKNGIRKAGNLSQRFPAGWCHRWTVGIQFCKFRPDYPEDGQHHKLGFVALSTSRYCNHIFLTSV